MALPFIVGGHSYWGPVQFGSVLFLAQRSGANVDVLLFGVVRLAPS